MAALTCELEWLEGLLDSLGICHPKAMDLYFSGQSALYLAHNSEINFLSFLPRCLLWTYVYSTLWGCVVFLTAV